MHVFCLTCIMSLDKTFTFFLAFVSVRQKYTERTCPEMQKVYVFRAYLLCSIDKLLSIGVKSKFLVIPIPLYFLQKKVVKAPQEKPFHEQQVTFFFKM